MDPLETQNKRANVSACLEAMRMYDADYHQHRGNTLDTPPPLHVVSMGQYWWTQTVKAGIGLAGSMLLLVGWLAVVLIVANGVKNAYDVDRAQPIVHTETYVDIITGKSYEATRTEPSLNLLPDDYWQTNIRLYKLLALVVVVAYGGSRISLRRARAIQVGVPLTHANTADMPASDSLVRASSEPMQTQQAVLLRAALDGQEWHEEQLVRASVRQE